MRALLFVVCFAAIIVPAHARLGETKEESIARYGKPEPGESNDVTLLFKKNGCKIYATFENDKCVDLTFTKEDGSDFTDDEIKILLTLNSQGFTWKTDANPIKTEGNKTLAEWTRTDGADASHGIGDPNSEFPSYFEICTKEYNAKFMNQNATDSKPTAAQKLQGF